MSYPYSCGIAGDALNYLSREQSVVLLSSLLPDGSEKELDEIAAELADLEPALKLAGQYLQRYCTSDTNYISSFMAELCQPVPAEFTWQGEEQAQSLSTRINNLGRMLQDKAALFEALQAFELAVAVDETTLGPEHPSVARALNKLGTVMHDLGDMEGAQQAFERALAIDEASLGAEHPAVARDVNNLGILLQDRGDLLSAQEAFRWALSICESSLGQEHDYTQIVRAHKKNLDLLL